MTRARGKNRVMARVAARVLLVSTACLGAASCLGMGPVDAASFTVDTTVDTVDSIPGDGTCADVGGLCSLRAAVQEANALAGTDTISLAGVTHTLTIGGRGENAAATGDLDLTGPVTITGTSGTVIDADSLDRIFDARPGAAVTIDGIDLSGGNPGNGADGGGITTASSASVTIVNTRLHDNTARFGGAISANGPLDITSSDVDHNTAYVAGGILSNAALEVTDTTIDANIAAASGGVLALGNGTLSITGSTISNNTAAKSGGGFGTTRSGTIADTTITDNTAGAGAGIYKADGTLTLTNSTISNNTATHAAGAYLAGTGTTTIIGSTIADNVSTSPASLGGGVLIESPTTITTTRVTGNQAAYGAGLLAFGPLTLDRSTVDTNTASVAGGGIGAFTGALSISNSTVSTNTATALGGGIIHTTTATLDATTITNNNPTGLFTFGVGEMGTPGGTTALTNTIVADKTAGTDCGGLGTITSNGHNLDTTNTCNLTQPTDQPGVASVGLGALADNGGPTPTHRPHSTSPAVDHIPNATNGCGTAPLDTDQRGQARPIDLLGGGALCDIGAVEVDTLDPLTLVVDHPGDTLDATPGNGICADTNGDCTLRAAIDESNTWPSADSITVADGVTSIVLSRAGTGEDLNATGDLDVLDDLAIDGGGDVTIDANDLDRIFHIPAGVTASVAGTTLTDGTASIGGGLLNAGTTTLTETTLSDHLANVGAGGGISNNGTLTLLDTRVTGNRATAFLAGPGGAITNTGTLTVTDSTIDANQGSTFGGGLHLTGGTTTVANSTISENRANAGAQNIFVTGASTTATFDHATVFDTTSGGAIGVLRQTNGTITFTSSIIRGLCSGTISSGGYNVASDPSGCGFTATGDLQGQNVQLAALADNGGPTPTHLPTLNAPIVDILPPTGSPAIDRIPDGTNGCGTPPFDADQRGELRPLDVMGNGDRCDAGAVEHEALPPPTILTVDDSGDTLDVNPGDGVCSDGTAAPSCTLRAAAMESNASVVDEIIEIDPSVTAINLTRPIGVDDSGGDLDLADNVSIHGNAAVLTQTVNGAHVIDVDIFDTVSIEDLTVRHAAGTIGRGIDNRGPALTLNRVRVTANTINASNGGGVSNATGSLTIIDSTISGNTAPFGGGISAGGTLRLIDSTVSGNHGSTQAGAIYASQTTATITNSTISGNTGSPFGAAIEFNQGSATLDHVTITGNQGTNGTAMRQTSGAAVTLRNSIVDGTCQGTVTSGGYNVGSAASGCGLTGTGDLVGQSVLLEPLADNGGNTRTHLPYGGSPVLGHIPFGTSGCGSLLVTDQRGFDRPYTDYGSTACEPGAIEFSDELLPVAFVVDTETDTVDVLPGDGNCQDNAGNCSLRAAVMETNRWPTADTITVDEAVHDVILSIAGSGENAGATGDLDVTDDVTIDGGGDVTVGGNGDRVFDIRSDATATLDGLTVDGGTAPSGESGGGIRSNPGTALELVDTRVTGNNAGTDGGGVAAHDTDVTVTRSTIDGNQAGPTDSGGGIHVDTDTGLTMVASTVSGNTADEGGGIHVEADAAASTITDSTITANIVAGGGGLHGGANLTVTNTVVADQDSGDDCTGTPTSGGHNLSSDTTCGFDGTVSGDIEDTNPSGLTPTVGPLADNGGPTPTHRPLTTSQAIDTGAACAATDQRGASRPIDGDTTGDAQCDIGAVEIATPTPLVLVVDSTFDDGVAGTANDAFAGDGVCESVAGGCTLRAAVDETNAWPTADTIELDGEYTLLGGAESDAGDLDIAGEVTIRGPGPSRSTIQGENPIPLGADRLIDVRPGADLTVENLRLTLGASNAVGGAVTSLGGAIRVESAALDVQDSSFESNYAFYGQAIGVTGAGATATIDSSTFFNNGNYLESAMLGGAVYADTGTTVAVTNSTMSDNYVGDDGSAVYADDGSTVTIDQSTIVDNEMIYGPDTAPVTAAVAGEGTVTIRGSVLANPQTDNDCTPADPPPFATDPFSIGFNVTSDSSCGALPTDVVAADPMLGDLQDNGGPTQTRLPAVGSPAIDLIPEGTAGCGTTFTSDQRGTTRPLDGDVDSIASCDAGAVEIATPTPLDLVVDSNYDDDIAPEANDASPGDGVCEAVSGGCTLRAAVDETNAWPTADTITLTSGTTYALVGACNDSGLHEIDRRCGDLDITGDVTIQASGTGLAVIDGNLNDRLIDAWPGADVTLDHLRLTDGDPNDDINGNNGGAILIRSADLTVVDSQLDANRALGGTAGGQAIFADDASLLTIDRTAIVDNGIQSVSIVAPGGGIRLAGGADAAITNSTIARNYARLDGSAIYGGPGSAILMHSTTIAGNGLIVSGLPPTYAVSVASGTITNSIIDGTSTIAADSTGSCGGATSGGHNIHHGPTTCIAASDVQTDPDLSPLGNYGGNTPTYLPLAGSPAIDTGVTTGCPTTDQRSTTRPQSTACDIGAVERSPSDP